MTHILGLWLASFAADNLWRLVLPLTDRLTSRVSYALAWGVLAALLAVAARWPAMALLGAAVGLSAAVAIWADAFIGYTLALLLTHLVALVACLGIVGHTTGRWAFAAAVGLAGGHALSLLSFLISRLGPIVWPEAGSELAMRYGPWASPVEALGCVLIMAIAMSWAMARPRGMR